MSGAAATGSTALLEVAGLHAGYGPLRVLHGIDLAVHTGEAVVLLGANGAGKTTTLRAISGMISSQGEISFDGRPIRGLRPETLVRLGIAHVPQGRGTLGALSVEDNLRAGAITRRDRGVAADIERTYAHFPQLAKLRKKAAGKLSGGEQQMLALGRAMLSRPRLLLLDEPSLGLAPLVVRELMAQLATLIAESDTALLLVEQNAVLALELSRRAYVLETGRIVLSGAAQSLRDDEALRRAYLGY
jgi:branched-chain amino acid transport system ATP-binding protein